MCPGYKTCQEQSFTCGMQSDGCGNLQDCGTCPANQVCTNGTCTSACTPLSCMDQGFDCGMAGDGCGGVISCGPTCPAGQGCGAGGMPNVCGVGMSCQPKTCADQNFNCGMQGDTCGNIQDCGSCTGNQTCVNGSCTAPMCTPKTCADQKFDCGSATDTCGTIINCGTCAAGETCGAGGPNQCGSGNTCSGPLCSMVPTCSGGGTTTITGTVYAPNGTDPLYGALVYVPNGGPAPTYGVQPFAPGVSCSPCGTDVSGNPLVEAVTGVDGKFSITGAPAGANIPLVIQLGRWRRQITIPSVTACASTAVAKTQTNMPNCESTNTKCPAGKVKGDIPLMAFATGSVDGLECVFRKVGVDDTEFTDPGGTGRIQLYKGGGSAGASVTAAAPKESSLWTTQAEINQYDIVLFPCQGAQFDKTAAAQTVVQDYANAGGRVFTTHYSYVWLFKNAPWNATATWTTGIAERSFATDPNTGYINMSFPKGQALAQWLQVIGASTTLGQIKINTLRGDVSAVKSPGQLWMTVNDSSAGNNVPMQYDFLTPTTAPAAQQCGRVVYNDYHVEDTEANPSTGELFPKECAPGAMTPQEKLMEFMLFDLASCAQSGTPMCTPTTCKAQGATCGPIGDGCGNILQCGMCPSGQACINGACSSGCTPKSCTQQGYQCGMQSDGCGNSIDCGACPSGTCGANGMIGQCSNGSCTPHGCGTVVCGATGDGCGNIQQCGTCPTGEACVNGMCQKPTCTPSTCSGLGYNCGMAGDGCGGTINCGTCQAPQTCGGGGKANICGGGGGA